MPPASSRPRLRFSLALLAALSGLAGTQSAWALTTAEARHLLARTGFAPLPAEIDALLPLSQAEAVDRLLAGARTVATTPPPAALDEWRQPAQRLRDLDEAERAAFRQQLRDQAQALKGWWYRELVATPSPLTEVMTLFWHNHFTSGLREVKAPALLLRQNQLLRRHALGNFGELLSAITRDPAMLLYLDGARSRQDAPNENFARELFELFTLGEGHYAEADVKEAARAFTGYSLDRESGQFLYRRRWHDDGEKTILGRRGRFDGDDVVELLLAQPRCAETIVEKLWRNFVSESPDPGEVRRLAALFRDGGYEMKPLLRALLTAPAFRDPALRGRLVRSPVELVVGTIRLFDIPMEDGAKMALLGRRLGQDLFQPPNAKGWPSGDAWITSESLLERQSLLHFVAGDPSAMGSESSRGLPDKRQRDRVVAWLSQRLDRWQESLPPDWRSAEKVAALLAPLPPVDSEILDRQASGALLRRILVDPVYQLK